MWGQLPFGPLLPKLDNVTILYQVVIHKYCWLHFLFYLLRGIGGRLLRADNLTTCMCRCLEILEASTSWSPEGPVQAYLTLYLYSFSSQSSKPMMH